MDDIATKLKRGVGGVAARLERLQDPSSPAYKRFCVKPHISGDDEIVDAAKARLRPAKEAIERILWDPALNLHDFRVGYRDRFNPGFIEKRFDLPNSSIEGQQRSFIKALPEHRIAYIKYRRRLIWHKELKLDRIFGTGRSQPLDAFEGAVDEGAVDSAPMRLNAVISSYDAWREAAAARSKSAMKRATAALGGLDVGRAKLFEVRRLSKALADGMLEPEDYVERVTTARFFGPSGWGVFDPEGDVAGGKTTGLFENIENFREDEAASGNVMTTEVEEARHGSMAPVVELVLSMPEEYRLVREAAISFLSGIPGML